MDRDLDNAGMGLVRLVRLVPYLLHAPFDEHLHIDRAGGVSSETIMERMIQPFEVKRLSTTLVRPVEKRAMLTH